MELAGGITQEDLKLFLQEADEQIQLLDEDIIRLEKESGNSDLMQEIFRAAHTLKGSSAMVGHQRMSELAHAMENVLDGVRKGNLAVNPQMIDALLHGLDTMRILRKEMINPDAIPAEISDSVNELNTSMKAGENSTAPTPGHSDQYTISPESRTILEKVRQEGKQPCDVRVSFDPKTEWASVRCFQVIQELARAADIIATIPSQKDIEEGNGSVLFRLLIATRCTEEDIQKLLTAVPDIENTKISPYSLPESESAAPVKTSTGNEGINKKEDTKNQTVRIDVNRLDNLMDQVGELVINRNQLGQIGRMLADKYRDDELVNNLSDSLSQIGKVVSTIQQDVMSIRLLPIEIIFNTMPRLVRDLARKIGKKIDFIIEGQETEVDRSVIEHLRDPLIHLLRNAVDHGIESPDERIATGKPETGTVRLSAYHEQDNIIIKLTDNGQGINPEVLRKSAVKKGILSSETAGKLPDEEVINLIFASGFSTARKITDVSGRGVGLDVVKTNIEALGGTVSVISEKDRGTQFTLTFPLTLAIIPALLIVTGSTTCAIPLSSIVETGKLEANDIKTIRGKEVTLFRNNVLPLLRLGILFGQENNVATCTETTYMVVVKISGTQVGIMVDALLEQQELVVKSLDKLVGSNDSITGASILGDGRVVLILDVASLVKSVMAEKYNTGTILTEELSSVSSNK